MENDMQAQQEQFEMLDQIQNQNAGMVTNCLYYSACKSSGVSECGCCPEFRPKNIQGVKK
jgi:hypothetical protein